MHFSRTLIIVMRTFWHFYKLFEISINFCYFLIRQNAFLLDFYHTIAYC